MACGHGRLRSHGMRPWEAPEAGVDRPAQGSMDAVDSATDTLVQLQEHLQTLMEAQQRKFNPQRADKVATLEESIDNYNT